MIVLGMQEIKYKCTCMHEEATLHVPYRRPDEDVIQWMNACVQPALYLDHRRRAPDCRHEKMEYAKIYMPENAPTIGGKPVLNG